MEKPPLGLEPRWIHDSRRAKEIIDAIERYTDANMSIKKGMDRRIKRLIQYLFQEE